MQLLLFIICYFGSIISAFVYHRAYAFVAYLIIYFAYPHGSNRWWSYSLPGLPYSFITSMLMIAVYLMNFQKSNKNKLLAAPQMVCAWILGAYYYFVNLIAINPELHMKFSISFLKTLLTISVAYKLIDTKKMLNTILFSYIGGTAFVGLLVTQVGRNAAGGRVAGVGFIDSPDTNVVAAIVTPAAILALYWFWVDSRMKIRVSMVVAGAFITNSLVLINSRGAFLGIIAGSAYFMYSLYFSKFRRKGQRMNVIILTIIGLIAAFSVIDESAIARFYTISEDAEVDRDQQGGGTRLFFWVAAYEMSKDYPFGMGKQGFNRFSDEYLPQDLDTGGSRSRSVHSTWFQTLNDLSALGVPVGYSTTAGTYRIYAHRRR